MNIVTKKALHLYFIIFSISKFYDYIYNNQSIYLNTNYVSIDLYLLYLLFYSTIGIYLFNNLIIMNTSNRKSAYILQTFFFYIFNFSILYVYLHINGWFFSKKILNNYHNDKYIAGSKSIYIILIGYYINEIYKYC